MNRLLGTVLFLGCAAGVIAGEGKLSSVRREVNEDKPEKEDDHKSHPSHCCCDCDEGEGNEVFGSILWGVMTFPFWAPREALEKDYRLEASFPGTPYPHGHPGHLWLGRVAEVEGMHEPEHLKWYSVRLHVENGNDFDGLNRFAGRLTVDTASRLGIHTHWDWFHEDLGSGHSDQLLFSTTNITYRFAQHEMFEFYAGLGVRTMDDGGSTAVGGNFIYGFDAFIADPLVLSASAEAGWLDQATVYRLRASLGVAWNHIEAFAGYDYLRVGDVDLHGPMLGLRLWW